MGGSEVQKVRTLSRRGFMVTAGSSAAAAAFLAACGGDAADAGETSEFGDGDAGILNYLLTLEHLEAAFYADIVASGLFEGADQTTMRKFGNEEGEHVDALTRVVERMGGEPATKPQTEFPLKGENATLELAGRIENLTAAAYLGQIPNIESNSAMATALSIHSVEGRHAATFDMLLGRSFTPEGEFAKPASAKVVLASVEPFLTG